MEEQIVRINNLITILQQLLFAYYVNPENVNEVDNVDSIGELGMTIEDNLVISE